MWTPEDRALVGDYGSGQALSDDQYRLLEPLIPPAKPGGRSRATDMRQLLDSFILSPTHRLSVAALAAASGAPALAHRVWLIPGFPERRYMGQHAPSPCDDAARGRGA